jgi:serine/threonine kinase PknH
MPPSPRPPALPRPGRAGQRTTIALVAAAIGLVVVILAGVGITSYLLRQPSTNSAPPTTTRTTAPTTAPAVAQGSLDGLLLSPDQINSAMGATEIVLTRTRTTTYDDSPGVADKACLPLLNAAQSAVYTGSGWTAMRSQELRDQPFGKWTHLVDQVVVLFPSAQGADALFTASTQQWPACSNRQYNWTTTAGKPDQVETVGPVSNANGTLSATETASGGDSSWTWDWDTCQRALTVANNVAIDVRACSQNRSDSQSDAGVNIARQIAAKVPTK